MSEFIRIRYVGDLWWTEIYLSDAIKWSYLNIFHLGENNCLISVVSENHGKFECELLRSDYDVIMNKKAFRIKFNLKKHQI